MDLWNILLLSPKQIIPLVFLIIVASRVPEITLESILNFEYRLNRFPFRVCHNRVDYDLKEYLKSDAEKCLVINQMLFVCLFCFCFLANFLSETVLHINYKLYNTNRVVSINRFISPLARFCFCFFFL